MTESHGHKTRYRSQSRIHHDQHSQYDPLGRLTEQTTTFANSISKTLRTAYHTNSQIRQKTDPESHATQYYYDAAGKISQIAIQNTGSIVVNNYDGHLPTSITYPGGIRRQHEYDGLARLRRILVSDSANTPQMDYQYQFDTVGNITQKNTESGSFSYQYDNAYRLTQADQPSPFGHQHYTYDGNGNRTSQAQQLDNIVTTTQYTYDKQQALTGLSSVLNDVSTSLSQQVDNNGALINDSTHTFSYNSFGRMATVAKSSDPAADPIARYTYDPYGRRISKTLGTDTTYFLYDDISASLVGEYTANGDLIRGYIYQSTGTSTTDPVALKTPSVYQIEGQPKDYDYSFYHNDHLGTPQRLMQISGATVWQADYDVFGGATETINQIHNPLRFAGQYYDGETGLHQNWHRTYDPKTGRYTKADPIGLGDGPNTYLYAQANPLKYTDPLGLWITPQTVGGAAGLVLGFGYSYFVNGNSFGDAAFDGLQAGAAGFISGGGSLFAGFAASAGASALRSKMECGSVDVSAALANGAFAVVGGGIGRAAGGLVPQNMVQVRRGFFGRLGERMGLRSPKMKDLNTELRRNVSTGVGVSSETLLGGASGLTSSDCGCED